MNLPLNIDIQQIFLHMFNFWILAGGLYLILYKPAKSFMDKRAETIKSQQQNADEQMKSAEAMKQEYEEKLASFETDKEKMREEYEKELEASHAADIENAKTEAANILSKARESAAAERTHMIETAMLDIEELAIKAEEKIVMKSDSEAFDRFLDAVEKGETNDAAK